MRVATRATKPVATAGLPAPFVDGVVVEDVAEDAEDTDFAVVGMVVPVATVAPLAEVVPPMGAVDWPLISAWTEELNVPLIPAILVREDGRRQ